MKFDDFNKKLELKKEEKLFTFDFRVDEKLKKEPCYES